MTAKTKKVSRGPGRPRNDEKVDRREAILTVATELFLEQGFEKTTTDEIARRANASKHTIYSLYPNKVELFGALMKRLAEARLEPMSAAALQPNMPADELLYRYGIGVLRANLSEHGLRMQKILFNQPAGESDLAMAFWQNGPGRGRQILNEYLRLQVAKGVLIIEDIEFASEQFLGSVLGGPALRAGLNLPSLFSVERSMEKYVRQAVTAFLRSYAP